MFHGSTVLCPTADDPHAHRAGFCYGHHGSPSVRNFCNGMLVRDGAEVTSDPLIALPSKPVQANTLRLHTGVKNVDGRETILISACA